MPLDAASKPVLIVEDESDLRETLQDLLALEGFVALGAANGQEGLQRLRDNPDVGLILLDLMMPVMNGWELLEVIKNRERETFGHIPVVVVSAVADTSSVRLQYDCQVMKKPVDVGQLFSLARTHCQV